MLHYSMFEYDLPVRNRKQNVFNAVTSIFHLYQNFLMLDKFNSDQVWA